MKNFFSHMLKSVFVSIKLLSSSANVHIADEDVTEHVLCKEDEDCKVCEEEEKEWEEWEECWNAVSNEVKRFKIVSRSLD